ncbi:MAG: hypothetical protein A2046_14675 [Bacteroidetes bacterium GWA2_30_7]|nr:MAG: hypothetical protein A2046_14675 [Bacteroidetes bacterium GWA2_30_7]
MIKKKIAFFFILIANIVLLVNTFVPHHHHKSEVCIVKSHCEYDDNHSINFEQKEEHKHDGSNNLEFCLLKQLTVTSSNISKRESKNIDNEDNYSSFDGFQAILLNAEKEPIISINIKIQLSSLIKPTSNFVNTSLSLRAPPTV